MKILRIVFCLLAVLSAAASILVGILFGMVWFLVCAVAAVLFAVAMFFCKQKSEPPEAKKPDFMNSEEENAALRGEDEEK